jgi:DNA-binding NarL/FixJ family response regulator
VGTPSCSSGRSWRRTLAEGRSNLAIANRLAITEKAVARHAAQIYDTLGLPPSLDDHRRVLAVVRFLDR